MRSQETKYSLQVDFDYDTTELDDRLKCLYEMRAQTNKATLKQLEQSMSALLYLANSARQSVMILLQLHQAAQDISIETIHED